MEENKDVVASVNPEALLKSMGLTEYESKALITVLKFGSIAAEKISELAGIPLPRVYDTVAELQRKGFLLTSKTRPKKFKAVPVEKALIHYIDLQKKDYENKISDLRSNIKNLIKPLSSIQKEESTEESADVWSIQKRRNIIKILDEQKEKAKKEILVFSGDISWINHAQNIIEDIKKRGVKIRAIICNPRGNAQILENIRKAKKAGIQIKVGYTGSLRGHVIDDKIAALTFKYSKEGVNLKGEGTVGADTPFDKYEMTIFEIPVIISTLKENFEFWWNQLGQKKQ